ncbi:hypothetical protein ABGB12_04460 [Actinocorallia sp. B10E7]|uniref:hypothetical protein n=1 Tax=Actinocorallia sp. B10E7 TaxID=3153558 RepID=UPI00325C7EE8
MTGQSVENLEETLNLTLERHAERAPAPAPDLIERVETRYRKRRRARMTGAAAAMVLVLGGTVFGGWSSAGPDRTVGPADTAASPLPPPEEAAKDPFEITPIEKLWPKAVHRIPARLPDGTEIAPRLMIDERTVLVNSWAGFETVSALYTYDLRTKKAAKIIDVVTPAGSKYTAGGFAVGEGRVVWSTVSADRTSTIWSAPVGGGAAVKAVERFSGEIGARDTLTVSGGRIYWSEFSAGVYTAPLAGGTAELVPGTEKERLVRWPWAGSPVPDRSQDQNRVQITGRELRNLETGEKRTVAFAAGGTSWNCKITWCLDRKSNSITTRNGTGTVRLHGHLMDDEVALDRFAVSMADTEGGAEMLLHDLRTRRTGSFATVPGYDHGSGPVYYGAVEGPDTRMYTAPVAGGHLIVDLKAID